jgi:hypothetical protein
MKLLTTQLYPLYCSFLSLSCQYNLLYALSPNTLIYVIPLLWYAKLFLISQVIGENI